MISNLDKKFNKFIYLVDGLNLSIENLVKGMNFIIENETSNGEKKKVECRDYLQTVINEKEKTLLHELFENVRCQECINLVACTTFLVYLKEKIIAEIDLNEKFEVPENYKAYANDKEAMQYIRAHTLMKEYLHMPTNKDVNKFPEMKKSHIAVIMQLLSEFQEKNLQYRECFLIFLTYELKSLGV